MKHWIFIVLLWPFVSSADFKELGKSQPALKEPFVFKTSPIKVVQKRWLNKRFLSEISLSVGPILREFNYTNSYSADLFYRFFLNDYFSLTVNYSYYFNPINQDGKTEVYKYGRVPLELKYYPEQSYSAGVNWHPFYGKAVLYNQLLSFDLYLSASAGQMQLKEKRVPLYSLGLGQVHWWSQKFNTRLELKTSYYQYNLLDKNQGKSIPSLFYSLSLSAGVLF